MPDTPSVTSYRLSEPELTPSDDIDGMLSDGPLPDTPTTEFAVDLLKRQLDLGLFEVLTPLELLQRRDDSEYANTIGHLSVKLGSSGTWLVDADLIVRESDKGYPVAIIWVCDAVADGAERIAYWAGKFGLGTVGDLCLCVLTLGRASDCTAAERERKEAIVMRTVDKVYWLGVGHPTDRRLTRFADLQGDVVCARGSVLGV